MKKEARYKKLQSHVNALCNKRGCELDCTHYYLVGTVSIARVKKRQTCCNFENSLQHIAMVDSFSKWANSTLQTCQALVQSQWAR